MNEQQRESYERLGYVVVRDAISTEHVAELNRIVTSRLQHETGVRGAVSTKTRLSALQPSVLPHEGSYSLLGASVPITSKSWDNERAIVHSPPHGWDEVGERDSCSTAPFRALIDVPSVTPILQDLLGNPAWGHALPETPPERLLDWRLDHDYIDVSRSTVVEENDEHFEDTTGGFHLHGGLGAHHVTVVWELRDVNEGDGGFCCVAGSHRPDFAWCATIDSLGPALHTCIFVAPASAFTGANLMQAACCGLLSGPLAPVQMASRNGVCQTHAESGRQSSASLASRLTLAAASFSVRALPCNRSICLGLD